MKNSIFFAFYLFLCISSTNAQVYDFPIDKNHSTIGFIVPILGGFSKVTGKFMDFDFVLIYDKDDITKSTVQATIKTASITTGIADRDNHLRTADFFDAENFPEATFVGKQIRKNKDEFFVIGDFTLRGVTKELTIPFNITGFQVSEESGRATLGAHTKFSINRLDYGVSWQHSAVDGFVGNEIDIELNVITKLSRKKDQE